MTNTDDFHLEGIAQAHTINAALFVPFVIHRLGGDSGACETQLTIRFHGLGGEEIRRRQLRLRWNLTSIPVAPFGVSEATVTEWAALGVACVVAALYGGMSLQAVGVRGDRFDYWMTRGTTDYGLEVS